MSRYVLPALLALPALSLAVPAQAQDAGDVAAMRAEIARLRTQLEQLESRLSTVEANGKATTTAAAPVSGSQASAAPVPVSVSPPATATSTAPAKAETQVAWKGAPQWTGPGGVSFKPRGRIQFDGSAVSRPQGVSEPTLGWSNGVRRAFLGVDGKFGAGLGYRFEVDFAGSTPQFTDVWITYKKGPLTFTLGHDRLTTLEDLTSDLDTSFLERAAFVGAFGFERRLGLSVKYSKGDLLASAGIYTDDLATLGSGVPDDSYALDTRFVYHPKIGGVQWHLGASAHHRELNALATALRYRARPGSRTTSARFVDTGLFSANAETGYGVEFAAVRGPLHVASEAFWQNVTRPGLPDPTFFGSYAEIGYVLGGARGYEDGSFGKIIPRNGIDKGGLGALQANLRYDWLDLNDRGVRGGTQRTFGLSMVWVPMEHVKFMADYLRVMVANTPILAGSSSDYDVDVIGLRAQYDF